MPSADDYAQGLLDQPVKEAEATTYDPNVREINQETDTVAGQMDTLMDKGGAYMQRAANTGMSYAQGRGLLNSSLGAQASQAASIDAALPIAQQDASINMTQGLANQDALNKAGGINAGLESDSSKTNATLDAGLKSDALSVISAAELQKQADEAALNRTEVTEAGAKERLEIGEAGATERLHIAELSAMDRAVLGETGATSRANSEIVANKLLNDSRIASEDRTIFTQYYDNRGRYQLQELARISEHPDLTAEEKTSRITDINASYTADIKLISDIFAVPLGI